jgi:hypothetical protein
MRMIKMRTMSENEMAFEWIVVNTIHDCRELIDIMGFPKFLLALKASTQNLSEEDRLAMIKMLEEWKL